MRAHSMHRSGALVTHPRCPHPLSPHPLAPQMGMKITNEAPVGIKAGLRASYAWVTQEMLDAVNR